MHIEYLRLKNFGPFENYEVRFKHGMVGIFGKNGSGKSTLVNGIYAGLTNDFSRFSGTKADRIYGLAPSNAESYIELTAVHEGVQFDLVRSLRPNRSSLKIKGQPIITKATEIERELTQNLGVNFKLISTYVFVDQWQMFQFLESTPSQRAEAFKHLCGTQVSELIFDECQKQLSKLQIVSEIVDDSDDLITKISKYEESIKEFQGEIWKQEQRLLSEKALTAKRRLTRRFELKAHYVEEVLPNFETRLTKLKKQLQILRTKLKKRRNLKDTLEEALNKSTEDIDRYKKAEERWQAYNKYEQERQTLEAAVERARESKPVAVDTLQGDVEALIRKKSELETKYNQADEFIESISDAVKSGICPTCKQPIKNEAFITEQQEIVDSYPKQISELKQQIKDLNENRRLLDAYKINYNSYQHRLETAESKLSELVEVKKPRITVEEMQSELKAHEDLESRFDAASERYANLRKKFDAKKAKIEYIEQEKEEIQSRVEKLNVSEERYNLAVKKLRKHDDAKINISSYEGQMKEATKTLDTLKESLAKLRTMIARREKKDRCSRILSTVRDSFHWNSLPRLVAAANLARMQDTINKNLEPFGSPFWIESTEDLEFKVHLPGLPARTASDLSGGQKAVLAIAFRGAVNSLFRADVGTMFLDEPTSGLDSDNLASFAEALQRMAKEVRGRRQLVMITHEDALKSAFDQVITVGE